MRVWERLKNWAEEEAQSAATYKRLADTAVRYDKREEGLLRDPALQLALDWQEKYRPNAAWARRYHPGFQATMNFLEASRTTREAETKDKEIQRRRELIRARLFAGVLSVAFLIAAVFVWLAYQQQREALQQQG